LSVFMYDMGVCGVCMRACVRACMRMCIGCQKGDGNICQVCG